MNAKVIIGVIIALAVFGIGVYSINSSPSELVIEDNLEVDTEGTQYVLELSDSVSMAEP